MGKVTPEGKLHGKSLNL